MITTDNGGTNSTRFRASGVSTHAVHLPATSTDNDPTCKARPSERQDMLPDRQ